MDASEPVMFMQNLALRKYVAKSRFTEVGMPDDTLKHSKVMAEAIAAGIEALELGRKKERKVPFDLVTHDPDALFNTISKQRNQSVIETNDAERRHTAKRRDSRSLAAAGTKPKGSAADEHDSCESAKAAGVKEEKNRRYDNNECFVCGQQCHKKRDCHRSQQGKAGKIVHGQSLG